MAKSELERNYWLDNQPDCIGRGGIFFRCYDLVRLIEKTEEKFGRKVVAIRFEPDEDNPDKFSNNGELILEV